MILVGVENEMAKQRTRKRRPTPATPPAALTGIATTSGKSRTLVMNPRPGQSPDAAKAELMVTGLAMNAVAAMTFSGQMGELDVSECLTALRAVTQRINGGDLSDAESLLAAQSIVLNTVFLELSRRAALNIGEHLDVSDRYLRLALKAQSQCRATIETLALMKNPPAVFARQANIANGPQQVNNGPVLASRAGISESEPNKLLEAYGEGLAGGTAGTTSSGNQTVAALGSVNRAAKRRG